ncbi:hypothetical protein B0H19DRAFT_1153143 [Mycena capillaripes]|nr:hypothetical protein B0H19DRAFT_1153143 [Mycena capillaripes]
MEGHVKEEVDPENMDTDSEHVQSGIDMSQGGPNHLEENAKEGRVDELELTFQQKKELGERIAILDPHILEVVIRMIIEEVPETENSAHEVEVEIDRLPKKLLIKLYNFVFK